MGKKSIVKSTVMVSIFVILCKLLGFAREAIIAALYGANASTDAFFFAQGMPGSIFPSVCNSISTAFTSLYVSKKITSKKEDSDAYASKMIVFAVTIGICLSLIGVFLSPIIVPVFSPGFSGDQKTLAIELTRITMGAFFLIMIQYMVNSVLQSNQKFLSTQIGNIMYNIVVVVLTIVFGSSKDMHLLSWIVVGGLACNVLVITVSSRKVIRFKYTPGIWNVETRELVKLALPIILGNSVVQLNNIVDKALASGLSEGSISSLNYANTINVLVISVFITSLSTVLYPSLAEKVSTDANEFVHSTQNTIVILTAILVPISSLLILDSNSIISIVFERGSFNKNAVVSTASVLMYYSPYLIFSGAREVLTRAFFAKKDTKTPMINSAIGVGLNIVFSVMLVRIIGLRGLAAGTTLSSIIITLLLVRAFHKIENTFETKSILLELIKELVSGTISIIILLIVHTFTEINNIFIGVIFDGLLMMSLYSVMMIILKSVAAKLFISYISKRVKKLKEV